MLYLALFGAAMAVELSIKVNTENILKKIGIGFIAVGSLVELYGKDSNFIEYGALIYLIANLISAYCTNRKRRSNDK